MLDIQSLKSLPTSDDVFKDLKIDPSHKLMVVSLVKSHLEKQAAQKLRPGVSMNQDLIRGKGSGLVILLHGVPGVGKTATAEAIAQTNRKPLFVITCGDLGFTPKEVEDSLKDIFRLAHLWDCILLLDEADIFLSRRELGDLKRNALVSVFLRVLEYYSGILFLTTNRVGTMDEAFKSRIHISLYYPPLSEAQTIAIFKVNIRKLREILDEKEKLQAEIDSSTAASAKQPRLTIDAHSILHYAGWHYRNNEESPEQRWNGRQIRNAFQIAHSLAQFDMSSTVLGQGDEPGDEFTPHPLPNTGRLDWSQFDMVAKAIEKFEGYLFNATNSTDGDRARRAAIREDDYDHYSMTPQKPAYNPPPRELRQVNRPLGRNRAPNPPHRQSRQYQPPQRASRDDQTRARNPQGKADQHRLNSTGGGRPPRNNPNIGGLSGSPARMSGPKHTQYRPLQGQGQPQQRKQPVRATKNNHTGNKAANPATHRRNNQGYQSGWDIDNTEHTAAATLGAPEVWQERMTYDDEQDMENEDDLGNEFGDSGNYGDDYYENDENDLEGVGDDGQFDDDGADAELYNDYDDMTARP
ncbi:P-loop containing nucleoside triphosphate hydrolase protein [Nemania sp. FL0916]|nr:P-loop containing nucleoside triphosphate hydrolase protein [Nemania sp. FL0916]